MPLVYSAIFIACLVNHMLEKVRTLDQFDSLYFDESHDKTRDLVQLNLQKATGIPPPTKQEEEYTLIHTAYQSLCSAFNTLLEFDCFVIFLSTNSSLARYSPSQKRLWSSRSRDAPIDTLQAPFVEPFDTWSNPTLVTEGIPDALLKLVRDGLISKGERGELVARLLLILAHDRAVHKARTNSLPKKLTLVG